MRGTRGVGFAINVILLESLRAFFGARGKNYKRSIAKALKGFVSFQKNMAEDQPAQPAPASGRPQFVQTPGTSSLHPQFAVFAISDEKELSDMEHFLKGDVPEVDADGLVSWSKGKREALLNEQGVYEIMEFLRHLTSKVIKLSNASETQVYRDILDNCLTIDTFLFLNYRRIELKPTKYLFVVTQIVNFIEYSFLKAKEGQQAEFIHPKNLKTTSVLEYGQTPPAQTSGGPLKFLDMKKS